MSFTGAGEPTVGLVLTLEDRGLLSLHKARTVFVLLFVLQILRVWYSPLNALPTVRPLKEISHFQPRGAKSGGLGLS